MSILRTLLFSIIALSATASAQWRTESFDLVPGWQGIYLRVDPGLETIDTLLAANPGIAELWQWRPSALDARILDSPEAPVTGDEWLIWKRGDTANSTMSVLSANAAYLVRLTGAATTLSVKGAVAAPTIQWRTDGLNLLGFPSNSAAPPSIDAFFGPSELLEQTTEIYGYTGGDLRNNVNPALLAPRFGKVNRGSAYWIRTNKYADYDGPLRVRAALGEGLDFGASGNVVRLVITNRADRPLTATLTPTLSEPAPGETAAPTPLALTIATRNDEGVEVFTAFGASQDIILAASETRGISIGLDRSAMVGAVGDLAFSLLQVTDSEQLSEVYLPARAEISGLSGLWAGRAEITHVQNQLQRFQKDADGNYIVDERGKHVAILPAVAADTTLNKTAQVFPLNIIVHVDDTGEATLLSQSYTGAVAKDADGTPILGVATSQDALLADSLDSASRLVAVHLPPGVELALPGSFAIGGSVAGELGIAHTSAHNPFIHTYHPDHDNLDARFENPLPKGIESHQIDRSIALTIDAAPGEVTDPSWGTSLLTGTYTETISGLHKNPIAISGVFALRKIADVPTITPAP